MDGGICELKNKKITVNSGRARPRYRCRCRHLDAYRQQGVKTAADYYRYPGVATAFEQTADTKSLEQTFYIYDTVVDIKVFGDHAEQKNMDDIQAMLERMDIEFSRTKKTENCTQ